MLKMLYYYKIIDKVSGENGIKQDIYCKKMDKIVESAKMPENEKKIHLYKFPAFYAWLS